MQKGWESCSCNTGTPFSRTNIFTQGFFFFYSFFFARWKWEFCDLFYLAYSEVSLEHFGTVNTVMQYLRKVLVLLSKISSLSVKSIATILWIIGVNGACHLIIFNDSWGLFYKPFKGGCFILNSSINFPNVGGYALWYIASLFEVMTSLTIDRKSDNFTQSTKPVQCKPFQIVSLLNCPMRMIARSFNCFLHAFSCLLWKQPAML